MNSTVEVVYNDRRLERRPRVLKGAQVDLHCGIVTVDSQVRDMTDGGARLRLRQAESLPQNFTLVLTASNDAYPARVVWRTEDEVGICFPQHAA